MEAVISLPNEILSRADDAAKRLGLSRSEFFVRAAERWLDELDVESTTAAIDRAIARLPGDSAFTDAAAVALVERDAGA